MTDDDLRAAHRKAWRDACAEERAEIAQGRRRFAAVVLVAALATFYFALSAAFLRVATYDANAPALAWAIITGLRK
jgi:hypothetical protein